MILYMAKNRRLNDFIRDKMNESQYNPYRESVFGLETGGHYLNRWQVGHRMIGLYTMFYGAGTESPGTLIKIFVPDTPSGTVPLTADEQPYGWEGKINEHLAELSVWWAFELMSENEASVFLENENPYVIFEFVDDARLRTMTVQYKESAWYILDY